MAFRINMYIRSGDSLSEDKDKKHILYIDQAEKAMNTFVSDIFACYLYRELVRSRFGEDSDIIRRLEGDDDISPEEMDILDDVYEDILAVLEFYQNRLTSQGDPAIENMMVHLRFTVAYLMHMDSSRSEKHKHPRSNKKLNTVLFRHDQKDDLTEISHLDYKRGDSKKIFSNGTLDYRKIADFLDTSEDGLYKQYYRTILNSIDGREGFYVRLEDFIEGSEESRIWHSLFDDMAERKGRMYVRLFQLVDMMASNAPGYLRYFVKQDLRDMRFGNLSVLAPAMVEVKNRDDDLESSLHTIQDAVSAYPEALMKRIIFAIRVVDTVFRGSVEERGKVELSISFEGMIRLLDPRLFGWIYSLPPVVFCLNDEAYFKRFRDGIAANSDDGVVILEPIRKVQSEWMFGKRMKSTNRVPGGLCRIPEPELVRPADLPAFISNRKTPSIFVADEENWDTLVSYLSSFTRAEDRNKVISAMVLCDVEESMTFVNSVIPYATLSVTDLRHPFFFITSYTMPLIRFLMSRYLTWMASSLGVEKEKLGSIEVKDLNTVFIRKFALFCDEMSAGLDRMDH